MTIIVSADDMRRLKPFIERIERASDNVEIAYYDTSVRDFSGVTDDPEKALMLVRKAADEQHNQALQSFGWIVLRIMQGKA